MWQPADTLSVRRALAQCAFIHLDGSGLWRELNNYPHPPSGAAQIAVRSTYWSDSQAACNSLVSWTAQQNYASSN